MVEAVIVATARTPVSRAVKGSLSEVRPDDMSAFIIGDVLSKVPGLDPADVEDVIWGIGQPGGEGGYNIARVASILAGVNAPGVTVNRYCSSSLQTIRMAAHAIKAGEGDWLRRRGCGDGVALRERRRRQRAPQRRLRRGRGPHRPAHRRRRRVLGFPAGPARHLHRHGPDRRERGPVQGACPARPRTSGACCPRTGPRRPANRGFFEREITPYPLADGNEVHHDDGIREGTTIEGVSQLKPVFRPDGTVTAGNCCPLNDGAAAVVVMSDARAAAVGAKPLARVVATGVSALNPEIMGLGPIDACRQALGRAGMTIDDIDHVEINEAFAAQVLPSADDLGIDYDKLNPNGGSIALGHPFGMTGSRIMCTLLNGLEDADNTIGLESMCVGGGQGMAMIVERLN